MMNWAKLAEFFAWEVTFPTKGKRRVTRCFDHPKCDRDGGWRERRGQGVIMMMRVVGERGPLEKGVMVVGGREKGQGVIVMVAGGRGPVVDEGESHHHLTGELREKWVMRDLKL